MKGTTLAVLELFLEKSLELQSSDFFKFISQQGVKVSAQINQQSGMIDVDTLQPDENALNNFLFPIRIFILKNEACSIESLKKISVDTSSGVSSEWRQAFNFIYSLYTHYMDAHVDTPNFQAYTRREVIDVFFYGGKFHADLKKKVLHDKWKSMEMFYPLINAEFNVSLYMICKAILFISDLTRKELDRLVKLNKWENV